MFESRSFGRDRAGASKGKRERGSRSGFPSSNDPESMLLDMPEHIHPGGATVETKMVHKDAYLRYDGQDLNPKDLN